MSHENKAEKRRHFPLLHGSLESHYLCWLRITETQEYMPLDRWTEADASDNQDWHLYTENYRDQQLTWISNKGQAQTAMHYII